MNHRLQAAVRTGHSSTSTAVATKVATMPGPLVLDLIAALIESGAPPSTAVEQTGAGLASCSDPLGEILCRISALIDLGADPEEFGATDPVSAALAEALSLATRSGIPPSTLVRTAASEQRRRRRAELSKAVRRMEVLLVVPGAICLLPAFVLLGIAPVAIRLLGG